MKNIKSYDNFLTESFGENKFFYLFGELILLVSVTNFGDEINVEYARQDGTHDYYTANYKDYAEDFVETTDTFPVNKTPKDNIASYKQISKDISKEVPKEDKCNLVYYIGKVKKETIKYNIDSKLAYTLKATYSNLPQYKLGELKVEPVK